MSALADFQVVGIVSGSLASAVVAGGLLHTKVVRPVFRGLRRLGEMADLFLGDKAANPPIPSLPAQVRELRNQLGEHVAEYHARPAQANGASVVRRQQGQRR